jgi:hypothetical protein
MQDSEHTVNPAIGYLMAWGFVPLALLAWWYTYRTLRAAVIRSLRLNESERWLCRTCDSTEIMRLPANRISPYPGYVCRTCGQRMRPPGSTVVYVALLIFGLGLLGLFTVGLWGAIGPERLIGGVHLFATVTVVLAYSLWQLSRPTCRRDRDGNAHPGLPS